MTSKNVSDEQLGKLARRQQELFRRVREGTVPVDAALKGLQSLIEEPKNSVPESSKPENGIEKPDSKLFEALKKGFVAKVEYKSPTIEDLQKLFPIVTYEDDMKYEPTQYTKDISRETCDVSFVLMRLGVRTHTIALQSEMSIIGFRPATFEELVAFAVKYPEEQERCPIVALGSVANGMEDHALPTVGLDGEGERCIDFTWYQSHWDSEVWFLAVPEAASPFQESEELPPDHYQIVVTSTKDPTFEELMTSYDLVDLKLELHESLRGITPSTGKRIIFVKKFDRFVPKEEAIAWAKNHGYRLAFPIERETFLLVNPGLRHELGVVDLGSFFVHDVRQKVPMVYERNGRRFIGSGAFGNEYDGGDCFLFVREQNS